jgi:hypothetical protein
LRAVNPVIEQTTAATTQAAESFGSGFVAGLGQGLGLPNLKQWLDNPASFKTSAINTGVAGVGLLLAILAIYVMIQRRR